MSNGQEKPKPADKPKKTRKAKPLVPLQGEAAKQYHSLQGVADSMLSVAAKSVIPTNHLRKFKAEWSAAFKALLTSRKVDPKVKAKARLEAKLASIKAKLAEFKD